MIIFLLMFYFTSDPSVVHKTLLSLSLLKHIKITSSKNKKPVTNTFVNTFYYFSEDLKRSKVVLFENS